MKNVCDVCNRLSMHDGEILSQRFSELKKRSLVTVLDNYFLEMEMFQIPINNSN